MTRLINLEDEVIVLYANETKAKCFNEDQDGEDYRSVAMDYFNEKMLEEQELGIEIENLKEEKLRDEYLEDCKHDDTEAHKTYDVYIEVDER